MGEGQSHKEAKRYGESGMGKGPLEGCPCIFAQGPRVPSYATEPVSVQYNPSPFIKHPVPNRVKPYSFVIFDIRAL